MDAHDLDQEPQPSAFLIPLISAAVHGNHQALVAELEGMPPKSDYVQEHCVEVLAALFKTHKQCSLQGLCRTLTLILQKGGRLHEICRPNEKPQPKYTPFMIACKAGCETAILALTEPCCKTQALKEHDRLRTYVPYLKETCRTAKDLVQIVEGIDFLDHMHHMMVNTSAKSSLDEVKHAMAGPKHPSERIILRDGVLGWAHMWAKYPDVLYERDTKGQTPLMMTAQSGNASAIALLLKLAGDRVKEMFLSTDDTGRQAIHHAKEAEHTEAIAVLMSAATQMSVMLQIGSHRLRNGRNLAMMMLGDMADTSDDAVMKRRAYLTGLGPNMAGHLLCICDKSGASCLSTAIRAGNEEMVSLLLELQGLQEVLGTVDKSDYYTPLGFAVATNKPQVGKQILEACRREGIPIELALMGSADKRFSAGLRAPLFAAVHSHTPCFEWLDEAQVDISAPLLQVCYLQFDKAGAATGNTLMCAPDCALLQAKRDQFEAFTLLMCAASAGNKAALQYLLRAGMQEGEQARTKGNSFLIDAMAAAADFPGLLDASGRAITGPYKVLGAHLACILALLKAKCPMSKKQYEAMLVGLYAYTHTKQPDSCPYREDWGGDGLHRMHAKAMAFLRLGEDSAILSLLEA